MSVPTPGGVSITDPGNAGGRMKRLLSWWVFVLVLILAAGFVYTTTSSLPRVIGSHFVAGGRATGYMRRDDYLLLMLATVVGVPLFMSMLSGAVRWIPARFVNLPHREYWLAPERRAATMAYVARQGVVFGILLAGFLCFIHWLVVVANRRYPPQFPESMFFAGFAIFVVALVVWLVVFILHFRRRA